VKIGYARASKTGQGLDAQIDALTKDGCEKIFKDKVSSSGRRVQLQSAFSYVKIGDVFVITQLDRLAKSMIDLSRITKKLKTLGVGLKVINQPDIDTTTKAGETMVFSLLSTIATFERALIRERTAEGRTKALKAGVKFGAKAKLTEKQLKALKSEFSRWKGSKTTLASKYGISRASLYRLTASWVIVRLIFRQLNHLICINKQWYI